MASSSSKSFIAPILLLFLSHPHEKMKEHTARKLVVDDCQFMTEITLSCKYDGVVTKLQSIKR